MNILSVDTLRARPERATAVPQVAVVGCGYWGRNLVRVFRDLHALRTVCETADEGRARAHELAPDVPIVDDLDTVLRDEKIEAVVLATPAEMHAALASRALEAGKHVLVE